MQFSPLWNFRTLSITCPTAMLSVSAVGFYLFFHGWPPTKRKTNEQCRSGVLTRRVGVAEEHCLCIPQRGGCPGGHPWWSFGRGKTLFVLRCGKKLSLWNRVVLASRSSMSSSHERTLLFNSEYISSFRHVTWRSPPQWADIKSSTMPTISLRHPSIPSCLDALLPGSSSPDVHRRSQLEDPSQWISGI